jgi:hypothetical protein
VLIRGSAEYRSAQRLRNQEKLRLLDELAEKENEAEDLLPAMQRPDLQTDGLEPAREERKEEFFSTTSTASLSAPPSRAYLAERARLRAEIAKVMHNIHTPTLTMAR